MKVLIALLLALSLNAAGYWTLTGVTKANIYMQNQLSIVKPETLAKIKEKMAQTLKRHNILMERQDSPTLVCSLEELSGDETYYVYVRLSLGEEVQTFRDDKSRTYAVTFQATDFIETDSDTLEQDILESLDFLLAQFSELYEDDNE